MRIATLLLLSAVGYGQEVAFVTLTPKGIPKVHENTPRARRQMSPCSTFKIPNAAIGLETGVIPAPEHIIRYDEKKHKTQSFWPESWSRDLDLRTAFRVSALWYFREIAERAGKGNEKAFVDRFQYGNRDISGWSDPFWVGSTLKISPVEQVEFLDRFFSNHFGLTPRTVASVEEFMRQEEKDGYVLYYKTGACTDRAAGPGVWLVGFVQHGPQRTFFAMNMGGLPMTELMAKRIEIGKDRLVKSGLWPK